MTDINKIIAHIDYLYEQLIHLRDAVQSICPHKNVRVEFNRDADPYSDDYEWFTCRDCGLPLDNDPNQRV